jgi:hypothetical protein
MQMAAQLPSRYGGRYVTRKYHKKTGKDINIILADDNPEMPEARDPKLDIFALARPDCVYGLGHARCWVNRDGTLDRDYLNR